MTVPVGDDSVRRWGVRLALGAWGSALLFVCATLLAGHFYTLPLPERDSPRLAQGIDAPDDAWSAVHVLYAECSCSARIVEHLFASERPSGLRERLLVVGEREEWRERAVTAGLDYETTTRARLVEELGIEAAPLLVVADPSGRVRYAGGYTDRKQGPRIRDLELIAALRDERETDAIPLYGCAVSRSLQQAFDPLGLRYRQ